MRLEARQATCEGANSALSVRFVIEARTFDRPYLGAQMESMAIYFPKVLRDEATMRIHWGTTIVPVEIKAPYRPED